MSNKSNEDISTLVLEQPYASNQNVFQNSPTDINHISITMKLIGDGIIVFRRFYEPISDISIIKRDTLERLKINITVDNINYISELIFYSIIYNPQASNTPQTKDDAWKLVDKNILNAFVNNVLNSKLNIEQTTSLTSQIWWWLGVNSLIKNWNSFASTKTIHLIYNSQDIIDHLNKLISNNRKVDVHGYYVIVKNIFKSLLIIDNAANAKEEYPKKFAKKIEQQIKAYKYVTNLGHDYISDLTIKNIDPTLASKHPLRGINHKDIRVDIINLEALLAKVKVQKSGVLSKSNAINRTLLCLLLLAQIFGIKMHSKKNNWRGSKIREFMLLILGKNLYDKYCSKLKPINRYLFDPDIVGSIDSLVNSVNCSPNYYDDLESAYLSFDSYLTEII